MLIKVAKWVCWYRTDFEIVRESFRHNIISIMGSERANDEVVTRSAWCSAWPGIHLGDGLAQLKSWTGNAWTPALAKQRYAVYYRENFLNAVLCTSTKWVFNHLPFDPSWKANQQQASETWFWAALSSRGRSHFIIPLIKTTNDAKMDQDLVMHLFDAAPERKLH